MKNDTINNYINNITKASSYFIFRNGPIKDLYSQNKISDEEIEDIQEYMQNHLAYLYKVLLEEQNLEKFNLIINTMDKFYVRDNIDIKLKDDGFEDIYKSLFKQSTNNITIK